MPGKRTPGGGEDGRMTKRRKEKVAEDKLPGEVKRTREGREIENGGKRRRRRKRWPQ